MNMNLKPFPLLQPLRACILGPPAVGKSTVTKQLCEFYKLHHIKLKDVIDEAIESLVRLCVYIVCYDLNMVSFSSLYFEQVTYFY